MCDFLLDRYKSRSCRYAPVDKERSGDIVSKSYAAENKHGVAESVKRIPSVSWWTQMLARYVGSRYRHVPVPVPFQALERTFVTRDLVDPKQPESSGFGVPHGMNEAADM